VIHNDNDASASSTTTTFTVTFTNPPTTGGAFTLSQVPNKLEVSVSSTSITVTSKTGNGNKGNFSFWVTPSSGCGLAQKVYVNVVN
jgi:hypothetical protein